MQPEPLVYVVDDDPKILRLVAQILGSAGIGVRTYDSPIQFLRECEPSFRGCLLLDIQLPELDGVELQRKLRDRQVDLPIVFLTATADVPTTVQIMKAGALDVVIKPFDPDTLVRAVNNALLHDAVSAERRERNHEVHECLASLTDRERQVMDLVIQGLVNKQIAIELGLSERTVEVHRGRLMKKMRAGSVAELVRLSMIAKSGNIDRNLSASADPTP